MLAAVREAIFDLDDGDRVPRIEDPPILRALRETGYDIHETIKRLRDQFPRPRPGLRRRTISDVMRRMDHA